jgi:nickel transport protein
MADQGFFRRHTLPALWVKGVLSILSVGVLAAPALAHRVLVFAWAEGDAIHTESKFVPDTPVRQGQVQIIEHQTGKVLLAGQTDDQGKFSCKIPPEAAAQKMDLQIVVEAAMGHRGEWLLKAGSYLPGAKTAGAASPAVLPAPPSPPTPVAPGTKAATVDRQMLDEVVNQALARQLAPIKEMLTAAQVRKPSMPDIMGGIGYIMGIFGLWAYFQSKKRRDS